MPSRVSALLVITALLVSTVFGAVGTVAAQDSTTPTGTPTPDEQDAAATNGTDNGTTLAPGQQLAVFLSAQGTEVESEVQTHEFNSQLNRSTDKAATARTRATELREQARTLRTERNTLIEEFRTGNLTKGDFLTRLARVNTKLDATTNLANRADAQAKKHGVNALGVSAKTTTQQETPGNAISSLARDLATHGRTDVEVSKDAEGNIKFSTSDDGTVEVKYRVHGSENLSINLSRDSRLLTLTVTDAAGEPVSNATVKANGKHLGETNTDGLLTRALSHKAFHTGKSGKYVLVVNHEGDRAMVKAHVDDIPQRENITNWQQDRLQEQYEAAKEKFEARYEAAHERFNRTHPNATDEAIARFKAQWDDRQSAFETKWDARLNESNSGRVGVCVIGVASPCNGEKWDKKSDSTSKHPKNETGADEKEDRNASNYGAYYDGLTMHASLTDGALTVSVTDDESRAVAQADVYIEGTLVGQTDASGELNVSLTEAMGSIGLSQLSEVEVAVESGDREIRTEVSVESYLSDVLSVEREADGQE